MAPAAVADLGVAEAAPGETAQDFFKRLIVLGVRMKPQVKESITPVFQNPLLGFRSWGIDIKEAKIRAATNEYHWTPGANTAACENNCGDTPGIRCHCGFNAFYNFKDAQNSKYNNDFAIIGAIAGTGKTELHSLGFRSEKAQIIAFFAEDNFIYRAIAEAYSVPLFTREDQFLSFVSAYANPIEKVKKQDKIDLSKESFKKARYKDKEISTSRKFFLNSLRFTLAILMLVLGVFLVNKFAYPSWDDHHVQLGMIILIDGAIVFCLASGIFLLFPWLLKTSSLEKKYLNNIYVNASCTLILIFGMGFALNIALSEKEERALKREVHSGIIAATTAMEEAFKTNGKYPDAVPEISFDGKKVDSSLFNVDTTNDNQRYSMTHKLPSGAEVVISGNQGVEIKGTCSNDNDAACNDDLYDFSKAIPFIGNISNPDLKQKCSLDYSKTFEFDEYSESLPASWSPSFKCF